MKFETMTGILPEIVSKALPGVKCDYNEGCELAQLRTLHGVDAGGQVYVNLNSGAADGAYIDNSIMLLLKFDVYIHTPVQDSTDIMFRVNETLVEYGDSCFVNLNGTDYKCYIINDGATLIYETEKWINYSIGIYV
jgi:hypothetical protein